MDGNVIRWTFAIILALAAGVGIGLIPMALRQPQANATNPVAVAATARAATRSAGGAATRGTPATRTVTRVAATAQNDPTEVVRTFVKALYIDGDASKAMAGLRFRNDIATRAGQAAIRSIIVHAHLAKAAEKLLGPTSEFAATRPDTDMRRVAEQANVQVTRNGNNAARATLPTGTIQLVLDQGMWKIDAQTVRTTLRQVENENYITSTNKASDMYESLAADIDAKKIATADDFRAELKKRTDAMMAPLITQAVTAISNVKTALAAFNADNGRFPTQNEALTVLRQAPRNAQNWKGPYLQTIPQDPWGSAYVYQPQADARGTVTSFNIVSPGPDRKVGGGDDVDANTKAPGTQPK